MIKIGIIDEHGNITEVQPIQPVQPETQTFKIRVMEKVTVWRDETVHVEARDALEAYRYLQGKNRHPVTPMDGGCDEVHWETLDHVEYDMDSAVIERVD